MCSSDLEIITMAIEVLKSFGLTDKDFYLRLNNRKLLQGIITNYVDSEKIEEVIRVIDKKEKVSEKDFLEMLNEVGVKNADDLLKTLDLETLEEVEALELNDEAKEGLEELKAIVELIDMNYVKLSLSTARGLAYYTGTVFEVFDKSGKFRSIAGGGRYDDLVSLLGGQPCPATGFAMGYSILSLLLKDKGLLPEADLSVEYYIAPISENEKAKAIEVANKLRKKYSVEVDLMARKLKKQFDYANNINAKKVIIIGEQEVKSNKLKVKDMKSGEEKEVDIDILLKKP